MAKSRYILDQIGLEDVVEYGVIKLTLGEWRVTKSVGRGAIKIADYPNREAAILRAASYTIDYPDEKIVITIEKATV